jgi:hypothetical protein
VRLPLAAIGSSRIRRPTQDWAMALWTDKGLVSPATWQDADAMTLDFWINARPAELRDRMLRRILILLGEMPSSLPRGSMRFD